MNDEMAAHCLKYVPEKYKKDVKDIYKMLDAMIILKDFGQLKATFSSFEQMRGYINNHTKRYGKWTKWSYSVVAKNPKSPTDDIIWENEEVYID